RRCRASLFASELPARRIQPLSHFCHTRISKLYCDDTSISPPNRRLTAHMPVCGCIRLLTQADFLCDITRHEPAGRVIMPIRKREWTTSKGEVREAWIVDYADQEGDRHIRTFEKKKDADAYHNTVKVDVRQGVHTAPSKSRTVAEAGEAWIKSAEADGLEQSTLRQYRQHLALHIAPRLGREKLAELTPGRIEAFRGDLLAKLSRPLARKVLTSLKSMLRTGQHVHVAADVSIKRRKR